jgi:hypothetical protein
MTGSFAHDLQAVTHGELRYSIPGEGIEVHAMSGV